MSNSTTHLSNEAPQEQKQVFFVLLVSLQAIAKDPKTSNE